MIRITDVSKRYGDMEVLSNIHFQLMKGEFVFYVGVQAQVRVPY